MKTLKNVFVAFILLIGCNPANKTTDQSADNPNFSADIEVRIEKVINNLQVKTSIDGVNDSKPLAEQMKYYHTPGVSIAVINEGRIEWARGFGKRDLTSDSNVDVQTLFQAGSVSKPIFALAVMRLKEKGVLDLDKDVNEYLKSWKIPANGDWQPKITLRQLLSHTAGLTVHGFPGYLKSEPIPTIPQILNGTHPANTRAVEVNILPGTTFRYSGGGITVAQLTIQDMLDKPFSVIIDKELFEPLKLQNSTYQQSLPEELNTMMATGYPYKNQPIKGRYHIYPEMAAAGLWSNPTELATLLIEVQKALEGESSLFNKETIEEMLTPQKIAPRIGIGFFLESKGDSLRFGHGGWDEGFVAKVTAYKNLGMGAVIMVNSNEGVSLLNEIMNAIAIEYEWPDFIPSAAEYIEIDQTGIAQYAGIYLSDENEFEIVIADEEISLNYQNQDPIQLFQTADGDFKNDQLNFSLTFKEDELHFNQHGGTVKYKKKTTHNKK